MNTYGYYTIDCNRLEKRLWEQNKFNTGLKLKLEVTKMQFENTFDYCKKKSCRVEQLETIID